MAAYLRLAFCGAVLVSLWGQQTDLLPGTTRWDFPADIAAEQHDELRRYFEGRIAAAGEARSRYWARANAVEQNRAEFPRIIGAVDTFFPPKPKIKTLSETAAIRFSLVEWPVLPLGNSPATLGSSGAVVTEYGVLLESKRPGKHPAVVAIADANVSAADISGITTRLPQREQFARSMAVNGYIVFAPFFTQRRTFSLPWTEDRDWLVRLGYQVGRHLIGSEVQQVSSAIDFLPSERRSRPHRRRRLRPRGTYRTLLRRPRHPHQVNPGGAVLRPARPSL